ncbi:MAG: hypothetical protein V1768_02005 [Patescibacteria group bacterium]|nr:hypothetical protein [Candidatus Margulisiibacteriota bacterium]
MTKISYIDLLPTIEVKYYSNLTIADRFTTPHVIMKKTFFSRKSIKNLAQRSLLPQIASTWAGLSETEKTAWTNAGIPRNLNGYRLFVADMSARIKNGITGIATPSLLHQSWFGKLKITTPADEIKITQLHPSFYWVSHPVHGKKGQREPIKITEQFALPLTISLNYKSNLTSTGAGSFAKYYAEVWYSYQGINLTKIVEISLDTITDWKNATATLSTQASIIIGYNLYFHIYKMTGELYIDNVKATHSGQNWVRDTYCEDILQTFTKAFYQIPAHWAPITLPSGAEYDSIYE